MDGVCICSLAYFSSLSAATVTENVSSQNQSTYSYPLTHWSLILQRFGSITPRIQEQIKRAATGNQGNGVWPPYASPAPTPTGVRYRRSGT